MQNNGQVFTILDFLRKPALRLRIGLVFLAGTKPESEEGLIAHPAPAGHKVRKWYLPPPPAVLATCPDLAECFSEGRIWGVSFPLPPGAKDAPYGEVLLNSRPNCTIRLGREDEEDTFPSSWANQRYVPLWLPKPKSEEDAYGFKPLFIEIQRNNTTNLFRMVIGWYQELIVVTVSRVPFGDAPKCFGYC